MPPFSLHAKAYTALPGAISLIFLVKIFSMKVTTSGPEKRKGVSGTSYMQAFVIKCS